MINLDLFGDIDSYCMQYCLAVLAQSQGDVQVNVCCEGGDIFGGLAIYNALKESGRRITTKNLGLAASMGSIVFLAGEERLMCPGSMLFLHNPYGDVKAPVLAEMRQSLIDIYTSVTGLSAAKISKMLDEQTWISAEQAVELGFATGLSEDSRPEVMAKINVKHISSAPEVFRSLVASLSRTPGKVIKMDLKQLCLVLGIPEGSSLEECIASVQAIKGADVATVEALDEVVARLNPKVQARIMALQGAEIRAKAGAVDALIKAHADVFSPALEAWARKMPVEAVQEFITLSGSKAKPAVEPEPTPGAPAVSGKVQWKSIAKALGKTVAQVQASYAERDKLKFPPMSPSEAFING